MTNKTSLEQGSRTALPAWQTLVTHADEMRQRRIADLCAEGDDRYKALTGKVCGIFIDMSKNLLTGETVDLLVNLARACGVEERRSAMLSGEQINRTERRAVLHTALRRTNGAAVKIDGVDVTPDIENVLTKMTDFVHNVHSGVWIGYTGKRLTDVVNLGTGGSDLGPRMVCEALKSYHMGSVRPHFVSNVDGTDLSDTLAGLNPETTLFIIASKTFTTQETMANARKAREWLLNNGGTESTLARHFIAVTANSPEAAAFGIPSENCFVFWEWVGGRYSLWSAVGLPIALTIGMDRFNELRGGAFDIDQHFASKPLKENLPVLLGLIGVWNRNFLGHQTYAILPYAKRLSLLTSYLQQAEMESNGKRITQSGSPIDYQTAPVLWGGAGTDVQHSFFQMLHQGTQIVPADFIGVARTEPGLMAHHRILMANFFAQTEALMVGRSVESARERLLKQGIEPTQLDVLAQHTSFEGNRPSTTLLIDDLTPHRLGTLIALYEHKIFVEGVIWDINSFDQWGVELGKTLAKLVLEEGERNAMSVSTRGLVTVYHELLGNTDFQN